MWARLRQLFAAAHHPDGGTALVLDADDDRPADGTRHPYAPTDSSICPQLPAKRPHSPDLVPETAESPSRSPAALLAANRRLEHHHLSAKTHNVYPTLNKTSAAILDTALNDPPNDLAATPPKLDHADDSVSRTNMDIVRDVMHQVQAGRRQITALEFELYLSVMLQDLDEVERTKALASSNVITHIRGVHSVLSGDDPNQPETPVTSRTDALQADNSLTNGPAPRSTTAIPTPKCLQADTDMTDAPLSMLPNRLVQGEVVGPVRMSPVPPTTLGEEVSETVKLSADVKVGDTDHRKTKPQAASTPVTPVASARSVGVHRSAIPPCNNPTAAGPPLSHADDITLPNTTAAAPQTPTPLASATAGRHTSAQDGKFRHETPATRFKRNTAPGTLIRPSAQRVKLNPKELRNLQKDVRREDKEIDAMQLDGGFADQAQPSGAQTVAPGTSAQQQSFLVPSLPARRGSGTNAAGDLSNTGGVISGTGNRESSSNEAETWKLRVPGRFSSSTQISAQARQTGVPQLSMLESDPTTHEGGVAPQAVPNHAKEANGPNENEGQLRDDTSIPAIRLLTPPKRRRSPTQGPSSISPVASREMSSVQADDNSVGVGVKERNNLHTGSGPTSNLANDNDIEFAESSSDRHDVRTGDSWLGEEIAENGLESGDGLVENDENDLNERVTDDLSVVDVLCTEEAQPDEQKVREADSEEASPVENANSDVDANEGFDFSQNDEAEENENEIELGDSGSHRHTSFLSDDGFGGDGDPSVQMDDFAIEAPREVNSGDDQESRSSKEADSD